MMVWPREANSEVLNTMNQRPGIVGSTRNDGPKMGTKMGIAR